MQRALLALILAACRTPPWDLDVDLGASPGDLSVAPDLAVADLAAPDLAVTDLAVTDLAVADLAVTDFAAPDLSPAPDLTPPSARQLSPLSTSTVSTRRPHLRWTGSATEVDLCATRDCATAVAGATLDPGGQGAVPDSDLPPGVVFWRLRGGSRVLSPTWEFFVPPRSAPVDASRGTRLDLNGDGLADLAIASYGNTLEQDIQISLYLGAAGGPTLLTALSPMPMSAFGGYFSSAGDVNGDGYGDLVTSLITWSQGSRNDYQDFTPHAAVYLGGPSGLATTPWIVDAPAATADLDLEVAVAQPAGDVNGDGYADILLGDPYYNGNNDPYHLGQALLYFGGPNGFQPTPVRFDGRGGRRSHFGISSLGSDLDGDGYSDVVIGAPALLDASDSTDVSAVYVFWGGPTIDTQNPIVLPGPQAFAEFGRHVWAADSDGDGLPELWIDELPVNASGASFDGNLFVQRFDASRQAATPLQIPPPMPGDTLFAITGASGDFDGDGYDDFAAGAQFAAVPGYATGAVHIYFGGAGGLATMPLTLTGPDGPNGYFGRALAAGDLQGDGRADLVVSAGPTSSGRLYFFAQPTASPTVLDGTLVNGYFGFSLGM